MKNLKNHKLLSLVLILAYVLSACSGAPAGSGGNANQDDTAQEVTFTGVVESIDAGEWTVSGQTVSVTGTTSVDANIAVGAPVKVEAIVDQSGVLTAVKIEFSGEDDSNTNDDNANTNDDNGNDDNGNDDNTNDDNANTNGNSNDDSSGDEQEVIGVVEAMAGDSITISGQEYLIDEFTEFKDEIVVGDQVKAQVVANDDGTFTVREIEKFDDSDDNSNDNDNSNTNDNSNDDNSNDDNGNDDNGNDDNGNDDNGNDDNSNDDNGNDDNSNDDNGNDDNGGDDNNNGDDNSNDND